tara:strand:- start:13917 stop:14525 length:609 start_codon:yes stop_codon:yes gene_type:complete
MTEITLHGLASKKFKSHYKMANIKNPIDAVLAIDANYDGFKNFFLKESQRNNMYQFVVDGALVKTAKEALNKKEIKKIDIVPYVGGHGNFAIAFFVNLAIGLIMAGIQYLMTPIPENEPRVMVAQMGGKSFWFASKENAVSQYTSVPIGYGELRVGSKTVEVKIDAINRNETAAVASPTQVASAGGSVGAAAGQGGGGGGGY